ncbi:MAG: crosslink repair DNA glycosylase YcaQ family protein [Chromatiales bacterium]
MFTNATQTWFEQTFTTPTEVQRRGWALLASGAHALLVAPTGSGKTLAAFLSAIDRVARLPEDAPLGVRVLYVSPLKALVYDVERNLRAPLVGIQRTAERLGESLRPVRVDVRTGDTPQKDRRRQVKEPGEILVTTPESLFLILGSKARQTLASVHTVIVDEVHALAPTKRGAHLALSLERLSELCAEEPQRIGLSATARPLDEVARFLGGNRPVEIIDASTRPHLDLEVVVSVADMERAREAPTPAPGGSILGQLYAREVGTPQTERGIWPAIYPRLLELIDSRRSTIIFVNSRGLCERLAQRLNELAGQELVLAHHGSVSLDKRSEIEEGLKRGRLRAIVATSSLELGVDMGAVDLVILVESPGSVARGLQRVGRAGHRVDEVSIGRVFPKFRGDLLECAVISARMTTGEIEAIRAPRNALDVLAQQIVALCVDRPRSVDEIAALAARAYPYKELSRQLLSAVLDMLAGHYPSTDFADLKPLLAWDRASDTLSARRGAAMLTRISGGTIPDRGNYGVFLGPDGPRVGELDEEMVFETRPGENILLGATTWRVEEITRDKVLVAPAPGEPGKLPFWRGDGPGRPVELGRALGEFTRIVAAQRPGAVVNWLMDHTPLDRYAAQNLAGYIDEQREHTGTLPTDRSITIERFRDELGDWRVCILSPYGARVHAPWAMALQHRLSTESGFEVQTMYTDDGIVLRLADAEELPELGGLLPDPDEIENLVTAQLAGSSLFAGLFRENAVRALLLPRRGPDRRSPLWAQRLKAQQLLATVQRYPSFPIVLETYRQALSDVFDLPALQALLRDIHARRIQVVEVETRSASPFARSLVFAYVAAYIYEQDMPLAERKAQALTLDRNLLAELLGQAELRELIDPDVLTELEAELQHLTDDRKARDADELHDLLRRLGELDPRELAERCAVVPDPLLQALETSRRTARIRIAGQTRWIAAEDAGLYRDALGAAPPPGLPDAFLGETAQPLEQLLRRYARSHGPFLAREPAERLGLRAAQLEPVLRGLEREGLLVHGEIRPGGSELDWCDAEVLRRLKRRTLARLRHEVAPVDAATLGCFLSDWQGVGREAGHPERLLEVVGQLEGLPISWVTLSQLILPARLPGFRIEMLDLLAASGAIVWIGRSPLAVGDGRIALYRRERAAALIEPVEYEPPGELHGLLLRTLRRRGACFLVELESLVQREVPDTTTQDFRAALWDLVWAGQLTNDTFVPLRSLGRRASQTPRGRARLGQALAGGRWSLVDDLLDPRPSETERVLARAEMLLERYGVVSREAAATEDLPGGFAPLYKVLKAMEESGRVRRGYFVEGLSGAQFGYAGAIDRLRGAKPEDEADPGDPDVRLLAATDPANPYGALLRWPEQGNPEDRRPRRVPGAWVVLVAGRLILYAGSGARSLTTFPSMLRDAEADLALALSALARLPRGARRRHLVVERIDGVPVRESIHHARMTACGFESDYRGLTIGG